MKKAKKILVLGATVNQLPFILLAKKNHYTSISMDNVPDNICHKYSDKQCNISTLDQDAVLEFAKKEKIDGIITCASDLALPTTVYVSEKLNLPSISFGAVSVTTNKSNFHQFLLEHKFNLPKHYVFNDVELALKKIATLSGNWIIKPTDSSGSKGVYFLNLDKKIRNLPKIVTTAISFSRTNEILLEEYVDGDHCSVDGFFNEGKIDKIIITNKLLTPLPYRTPLGHTLPSQLSPAIQAEIKANVARVLKLLQVKSSPFDFDVVVDKFGKVFILEMSLRIGGNGIPKLIKFAEEYDLYQSALLVALGEKVPLAKPSKIGLWTGVFLIFSKKAGHLKSIAPKEKILERYKENLKEIVYDVSVGDTIEKFISGNHRLGHFILQTESSEQLLLLAAKLRKDLSLQVS